jgi:hypothetical protein
VLGFFLFSVVLLALRLSKMIHFLGDGLTISTLCQHVQYALAVWVTAFWDIWNERFPIGHYGERKVSERYFVQVLGTERLMEEFAMQQKMTLSIASRFFPFRLDNITLWTF